MARSRAPLLMTTTPMIEGRPIEAYLGLVSGEAVVAANMVRDALANLRDLIGGRSHSYERLLSRARDTALDQIEAYAAELGADAVVGIDIDYNSIGSTHGGMMMVSVAGTAVRLRRGAVATSTPFTPTAVPQATPASEMG